MRRYLPSSVSLAWISCLLMLLALGLCRQEAPGQDANQLPRIGPRPHHNYVEKIPGTSITFEMVAIPGGTYLMGSPENEPGRQPDEGPQHPVTVGPFWMGKCEVTWDEYDAYRKEAAVDSPEDNLKRLKANADAITGPTRPYADETFGHGREGKPVLCITHHAAMEYCRWLSQKTGKAYRLPTEAEWEWACRAGTTTAYSFGNDPKQLSEYAWFADNAEDDTHPVGKKRPNPWGLYDMHGNVAEWCLDHYRADYYKTFPLDRATLGPVLLPTERRYSHVVRGGSWVDPPERCRSAARLGSTKDWLKRDPQRPQSIWWMTDADFVGFRIVRAVQEQENLKGIRSKVTRESDD
jgi:formylglycine-generating enzyme required for sulfatase activity